MELKLKLDAQATVTSDKLITLKDLKKLAKLTSLPPSPVIVKDLKAKHEFGESAITATLYSETKLEDGDYYNFTKYVLLGNFEYDTNGIYKSGTVDKWSAQDLISKDSKFKTNIKSWFYETQEININLTSKEVFLVGSQSKYSPIIPPWDQLNASENILTEYGEWESFYQIDQSPWFKDPFSGDYITSSSKSTANLTDQYYAALTSGDATITSKKMPWAKLTDFNTASDDFYDALEWSAVNMKSLQKYQATSIDWTLVGFSSFETKQYKQTDWSQVTVSSFTSSEYTEIDWGKVSYSGKKSITKASGLDWTQVNFDQVFSSKKAYKKISWSEVSFSSFSSADYSEIQWDKVAFKGKKSVSYSALDWSQVDFQDFTKKNFKKVNWKEAQTNQLTASQYSAINWSYVALKGKKSADYSKLDWSKVITNDTFSAKAAKKVDWNQLTYSALDSAALAKLKQDAFSGKNKKLTAWLDANTTSTTGSGSQSGISFAGIAQPQSAGDLTTGQESGGSAAQVLLAAVEQQPVLI